MAGNRKRVKAANKRISQDTADQTANFSASDEETTGKENLFNWNLLSLNDTQDREISTNEIIGFRKLKEGIDLADYVADLNEKVSSAELEIRQLQDSSKKVADDAKADLIKVKDEMERKIEERQIKSIEALGIFVALFSFISISIQIFNRISSAWSAGLFTLLIFCSLAILVVLLDLLLVRSPKTFDFRFILIAFFALVAFLSIFMLRSFPLNPLPATIEFEDTLQKKVDEQIEDAVYERTYPKDIIDNATTTMLLFKDCLRRSGTFWPCLD